MNRLSRERVVTAGAMACVVAASGIAVSWALQPVPLLVIENALEHSSDVGVRVASQPLDASVFDVVLWPAPEQAPPVQPATVATTTPIRPPNSPVPINLSLIAIVEADAGWQVALYDPGEQRIVLASKGDTVGAVNVREVTATTALLELAGRTRQLALQEDAP